jgi:hypothetical protein
MELMMREIVKQETVMRIKRASAKKRIAAVKS